MSNLTFVPLKDENKSLIRDIISLCTLILGSILISIGSFLAWGLSIGLVVVGVLFVIVSLIIGYRN